VSASLEPSDVPISPELAAERNMVRRLEAAMAAEHGVDTPAYWRAMSDRLHEHLRRTQPRDERAHDWLVRVAAAYRALAGTSVGS
jgi:hypothetical protein